MLLMRKWKKMSNNTLPMLKEVYLQLPPDLHQTLMGSTLRPRILINPAGNLANRRVKTSSWAEPLKILVHRSLHVSTAVTSELTAVAIN